ncbi:MAG: tRNA 5-methoxyuridine(34)/uridine 5-oxyacetic acid(34) synthase CmoB [Candidatus Thiodiazotropha sp.]
MSDQWDWRLPYMDGPLGLWFEQLPHQVEQVWRDRPHGDLADWRQIIAQLPSPPISSIEFKGARIRAGEAQDCDQEMRQRLAQLLTELHPWRKGPYEICGLHIDTEWRSDYKWDRLQAHIQPLQDRLVLDVGCGNGYHAWRMLGEGARLVIGIDPTQLFILQFEAIKHLLGAQHPVHLFPLGIQQLPPDIKGFDSVFSMGVFYHRQSPFAHLAELRGALRNGGELILETLVIEGEDGHVLVPQGRYAKMRNVWFIPTVETLHNWLQRAGFKEVKLIDISLTTVDEQRATEWMRFESLVDYLDPQDQSLTIEGYPAPRRAIFLAKR